MKVIAIGLFLATTLLGAAEQSKTFTGIITDTMCGAKHTMQISPDEKCVRECVRMDPTKCKYALVVGSEVFVLSDQKTPENFAAKKVKVTGTLNKKTKILEAEKIEAVR